MSDRPGGLAPGRAPRCRARTASTSGTLANLPADTPLDRLVALAHSRWVVEQFYEEAKGECGLADHQGRRWDSLHRHLALAMLAYSFLVLQRAAPPAEGGLPPLTAPAGPFPDAHRCVLVWLLQDLVLWFVHSGQIRPLPAAEELTKQY